MRHATSQLCLWAGREREVLGQVGSLQWAGAALAPLRPGTAAWLSSGELTFWEVSDEILPSDC